MFHFVVDSLTQFCVMFWYVFAGELVTNIARFSCVTTDKESPRCRSLISIRLAIGLLIDVQGAAGVLLLDSDTIGAADLVSSHSHAPNETVSFHRVFQRPELKK